MAQFTAGELLMSSKQLPCDCFNFFHTFFPTEVPLFRNDYFASGPSQSIGYAFGLWSELFLSIL